ncbi:hypothetical protein F01_200019 [Burkholderia cenocepacia]|nr:hypothetical protein F01_200019 [Burkholderia cenocepacia]
MDAAKRHAQPRCVARSGRPVGRHAEPGQRDRREPRRADHHGAGLSRRRSRLPAAVLASAHRCGDTARAAAGEPGGRRVAGAGDAAEGDGGVAHAGRAAEGSDAAKRLPPARHPGAARVVPAAVAGRALASRVACR